MMFQNNIMSKDMHLANNNQNLTNFGATDHTSNIYSEKPQQPQQIQSSTTQSMALSSSSPVQTMNFQSNLNGGFNGARLMTQNGVQQSHLMQLKTQDYMSNCSVIPQHQQRIIQPGYEGSPQHQQYQHQQPNQQQYYNQNIGNNGYQMNCNGNNYPLQSIQQNSQNNYNQFQQYQNQAQIQTNMQINQNKLGLQDDDLTGVIPNDLYSIQAQIQQPQHQAFRNQAQLQSIHSNHAQQNYNSNSHMSQNFKQQPTQIQPGQNNTFIQQQNFNLGRNENAFQQVPQMNIMQQSSPKLQPIQNQRLLGQQTAQQQDLSKITGLVSMEDEVNISNPLYSTYMSSPHNTFQREYISNGNINNLNISNNSNINNIQYTNANYSNNMNINLSNNPNNIINNNMNKINNNVINNSLNNNNIANLTNNMTNIYNNMSSKNNNMNCNNLNNNMISNNNNTQNIIDNRSNNIAKINNFNGINVNNNISEVNQNSSNNNNSQNIIDNINNNIAKINNLNSINVNNNTNDINQNNPNENNNIDKINTNMQNNNSNNSIIHNNSNNAQNSNNISNENINNNNLEQKNDENSDNENNNEINNNNDKVKDKLNQPSLGIQLQKKGRGRPRKITSDIISSMPITKKANTISSDSNTKNQITDLKSNNRATRSTNRIESSSSVQVGNSVKDINPLTSASKGKADIETSSQFTRGDMQASDKIEEDFEMNFEEGYVPTEEDIKSQQRILEAIQRKKYKEELKKKSQEQYSDDEDSENSVIDDKSFVPNSGFLKSYRQRLIGRSSNSKIFELKDSASDQNIGEVVKQVPHKMSNHHQVECGELRNEHRFLKKMCHPRIITLGSNSEFIRDRNFCGIVLPQAQCNLMQYAKTQRHGKISLSQIRVAFRQIAESIQYLHDNYISHNDIKPDNMFVFSDDDYKLADFGFAIDLPKPNSFKRNSHFSQTLRKQVKIENLKKDWKQRCKQYVAPELIKLLNGKRPRSPSDEKSCDVFALGVSFFIIIFYQLPFCGSALKTDQRYKHFFKGQFEKFWSQFNSMLAKFKLQENAHTEELKDLFNKVLEPEPTNRLTIEQVLEHPWLNH